MSDTTQNGPVTLHVCVTCKVAAAGADSAPVPRGQPLFDGLERAIAARGLADRVRLEPVECL